MISKSLIISILLPVFTFPIAFGQVKYRFETYAGSVEGFKDGNRKVALFRSPEGIVADKKGNLFITEYGSSIVRKIDSKGNVTLFAGQPLKTGFQDGKASESLIDRPHGIAVGANGDVFFCDMKNHSIRKNSLDGMVSTVAGKNTEKGIEDGLGENARFNQPEGIAINSKGELFIADTYNFTIRKIDINGLVSTFAGKGNQAGYADGKGKNARFNMPLGIAIDKNDNLYIADANYDLDSMQGNSLIRKIDTKGNVSTFAGVREQNGHKDGKANKAIFNKPVGIAIGPDGSIFIADTEADLIRIIDKNRKVSTIGGQYLKENSLTGIGRSATFADPQSITVAPNGDIYIADTFNNRIVVGKKLK
jgi:DNA-binding beta-propeller fold protein YncE